MTKADRRDRSLMTAYGITWSDYVKILRAQGGRCAVCRRPPRNVRLAVDHHHGTGVTRGLLCWTCNKAVQVLRDDPRRARRAAEYLEAPPAAAALGRVPRGRAGRSRRRWRTKRERRLRRAWVDRQLAARRPRRRAAAGRAA